MVVAPAWFINPVVLLWDRVLKASNSIWNVFILSFRLSL